jgi:hypothetical protein
MGMQGIEEELRKWGIEKTFDFATAMVQWKMACGKCGEERRVHIDAKRCKPEFVVKKMREGDGSYWFLKYGKMIKCPTCARAPVIVPVETVRPLPSPAPLTLSALTLPPVSLSAHDLVTRAALKAIEETPTVSTITPTPETPKEEKPMPMLGPDTRIVLKIGRLLDDQFDVAKHIYRNGYTDEQVGKELNVSPAIVAKVRRDGGYGELAEDPMYTRFRQDLEAVTHMLAEELGAIRLKYDRLFSKELEAVRSKYDTKFEELKMQLAKMPGAHHKAAG